MTENKAGTLVPAFFLPFSAIARRNYDKSDFFDIDGTLLPSGQSRIPDDTIRDLDQARANGILLILASGRLPFDIRSVREQYDFDAYLTTNGQYCFTKDQILREVYFPRDTVAGAIALAEEVQMPMVLCTLHEIVRNRHVHDDSPYFSDRPMPDLGQYLDLNILQLTCLGQPDEHWFAEHIPGCRAVYQAPKYADIIPADGGKETGINVILAHFGIDLADSMAFGDAGNDIRMLRHVGIGVAMGNAVAPAKAAADYVTADCTDDGIGKALRHFGLISP